MKWYINNAYNKGYIIFKWKNASLQIVDSQQVKLEHSNFLPITLNKLGNVNNNVFFFLE